MRRLAGGDSTSLALLWDIAELLRRDAEPHSGAVEAAPGEAIVVPAPSGDVARMANAEADVVVDVVAETPDAAAAADADAAQHADVPQPASLSRLPQVAPASKNELVHHRGLYQLRDISCLHNDSAGMPADLVHSRRKHPSSTPDWCLTSPHAVVCDFVTD